VDDWTVPGKDYVDAADKRLADRLDESAVDRERIREGIGNRVTDTEFGLLVDRVSSLERQNSRLYGAIAVLTVLVAVFGFTVRYLFG
jgi:hypothetical protein